MNDLSSDIGLLRRKMRDVRAVASTSITAPASCSSLPPSVAAVIAERITRAGPRLSVRIVVRRGGRDVERLARAAVWHSCAVRRARPPVHAVALLTAVTS